MVSSLTAPEGVIRPAELVVPIVRIRSHVLADILAWFSSHAARPGYLGIA